MNDVADIVADVQERGDAALADWSERFDGAARARRARPSRIPEDAVLALADAVRRWHELQRPADLHEEIVPGVVLERRWAPLHSVGIYVLSLVSTLVMRGCRRRSPGSSASRSSPPGQCRDRGASSSSAWARWAVGGPQAIAALAYGTETISPVDRS